MIKARLMRSVALGAALGAGSLAVAQTAPPTGVPRPGAVESAPLPPPGGPAQPDPSVPPPAPPVTPALPAPQAAQPAPDAVARQTLVPDSGEDVAEVTLPGKPAVVTSGTSTADEGFATLRRAFGKLAEEIGKAGITPAGRPVAVFQNFSPDGSFTYDAIIPIERAPEGRTALTNEIRFGTTPAGRALRFTHKGAYDDVESTYDMIEVYLEAKGIVVQDPIIEEFVTDPKEASDSDLELNIFVQPK
jgi:effector-binding domain-containing protein